MEERRRPCLPKSSAPPAVSEVNIEWQQEEFAEHPERFTSKIQTKELYFFRRLCWTLLDGKTLVDEDKQNLLKAHFDVEWLGQWLEKW